MGRDGHPLANCGDAATLARPSHPADDSLRNGSIRIALVLAVAIQDHPQIRADETLLDSRVIRQSLRRLIELRGRIRRAVYEEDVLPLDPTKPAAFAVKSLKPQRDSATLSQGDERPELVSEVRHAGSHFKFTVAKRR